MVEHQYLLSTINCMQCAYIQLSDSVIQKLIVNLQISYKLRIIYNGNALGLLFQDTSKNIAILFSKSSWKF